MSQTSKYEILYIIRPNIDEAAKAELVARFDAVLTDNGAVVVNLKTGRNVVLHTKLKISRRYLSLSEHHC